MMTRSLSLSVCALLGVVLCASCDDTTDVAASSLNLNRPVDIAFACQGGLRINNGDGSETSDQAVIQSPQPTFSCDVRAAEQPTLNATTVAVQARPMGQDDAPTVVGDTFWYAFILQSASGTVAMAQFGTQPASQFAPGANTDTDGITVIEPVVLDADPLTPGKNAISVGEEPVGIATDQTGCYEVTANAGSCDMSVLDVQTAVVAATTGAGGVPIVNRIPVVKPDGTTMYSRPAAVAGIPGLVGYSALGKACPAAPTGLAYVAYPNCHIVVGLDLTSTNAMGASQAKIVTGIGFDATGLPSLLSGPALQTAVAACPTECAFPATSAGAAVMPSPISAGARPFTLAIHEDDQINPTLQQIDPTTTRKLAIGLDNRPVVSIVSLDLTTGMPAAVQSSLLDNHLPNTPAAAGLLNPTLGVSAIALSGVIAMGGTAATFPPIEPPMIGMGGNAQYIYAVATDHTVRVVDVLGANNTAAPNTPVECDTQVDPRFIETNPVGSNIKQLQCFPTNGMSNGMPWPRRPGAKGPGIQPPGAGVPLSVAFVKPPLTYNGMALFQQATFPINLNGTFALITASTGATYVVNVDDDNNSNVGDTFVASSPQLTAPVEVMAHQLRDNVESRDTNSQTTTMNADGTTTSVPSCTDLGSANTGGPRSTTAPTTDASQGLVSTTKIGELPSLRQLNCVVGDAPNGIAVAENTLPVDPITRAQVFPDLQAIPADENWTMTWEGQLSSEISTTTTIDDANGNPITTTTTTAVNGPPVRQGNWLTDNVDQARLDDPSNEFCNVGTEKYDIVQLRGCNPANNNLDCPPDYECYVHVDTHVKIDDVVQGTCMLTSEADRLADACRDFLVSERRFTIRQAASGELLVMPRKHELTTTPTDGCSSADQCHALANVALRLGQDSFDPNSAESNDTHTYSCEVDDERAPLEGDATKKRCVETCIAHKGTPNQRDADCDVGSICVANEAPPTDGSDPTGYCLEGQIPPQSCVNAPQQFDIRAHDAFVLLGDQTGYIHPIIATPVAMGTTPPVTGTVCEVDPNADRFKQSRIPLSAPACTAVDPVSGLDAAGKPEPNPCSTTVANTDTELTYSTANACIATSTLTTRPSVPAIRLRTRGQTLTLVDPVYPGDAACPVDRGGAAGVNDPNIPLTFPELKLSYHITSGFTPLQLSTNSASFNPVLPIKVVAGPTGSIWVLDDGDFLSTTIDEASTEGAVYRIESVDLSIVELLQ